ncbi:condensin-2 complex subunit H2 isoform X2 [Aythya fuligula]|uniref:Condensin-2 complex subunit H2 n=1 Tax=Aythya fuligula TaxID=219594 RepID=A0A6J3DSQ4_AYTFU|nr:condensin-2 complex subunit H2 isoform X2 [Aythya fuligula]
MEDVESRFLHLLQPIRDLTKNWEVDVAAQLGEYLEELDQISISFDGGKTTMNFIEAALVIQGSACIYSRKVEYLYSLVYQALDFISNKKREKQPCSVGEDGRDADATFGTEEEEFLSLDDIKDTSQGSVDMRKDQQPSAVNIVPLTPMSLVPPEEAEKRNNPLFSHKGEVLASRKDFRMNTCTPHATGAFMLELAGLLPTGLQDWHHEGSVGGAAGARSSVLGGGREPLHLGAGATPVQALNFSEDGGAVGPDDSGDDLPMVPEDNVEMAPAADEHIEAQRGAPQAKGYALRERAPAQDPQEHVKEMLDPWQSLDPFGDSEDKPFKKGRPFLVPQGLDDVVGSKRKRKGPRKLQDFLKWFSASYSDAADGRITKRKGPTFADLEVLYWKQLKERLAAQRKLQSRARPPWVLPLEHEEEPEALGEEHEDDFGGDAEEGPEDFLEQEDIQLHAPEVAVEGAAGPCDLDALSYEELVRRNVELFIANSQRYVQETELSQHIRQWEEKMGPLLQEQEERAAFDIHSYGDRLAARFGRLGEWQPFRSLVAGLPAFEVCRYMLASLQLANDYTVEVAQDPGLEEAVDTMRLRLLRQEQARERFRTYRASVLCD